MIKSAADRNTEMDQRIQESDNIERLDEEKEQIYMDYYCYVYKVA